MKILFAGLGGIGQRHLRNVRHLLGDDVEVLAHRVRRRQMVLSESLSVESDGGLEETYGVTSFDDLDKALAEGPDIAFVTNPSRFHVPVAQAAADAGCHLFIEKPLGTSLEGVDRLIETVEAKDLVAFVGFQMRFQPGLGLVASLLDSQEVGAVLGARLVFGVYMPDWHRYEDYRDLYAAKRELGGGVIFTQIHELDYAHWLFGMPARVFCFGGRLSTLDLDVEDTASILMACERDARDVPVHVYLDFLQRPPLRRCEVFGEDGRIEWDFFDGYVRVVHSNGKEEIRRFDDVSPSAVFVDELKHFFKCVQGEEQPVVDLREGAASLRIALAARQSLATGEVVTPP